MFRKRGLIVFMAVLIMAGLLFAGCGGKDEAKPTSGSAQEPIKIGMVLDSSGNASSLGMPERNSALMLEEKINAAGGINGRPIKLIIEDSESDESKAVLKAKKLVEQDKVVAIVGATTTGTTMAMVKYIEGVGIPLISPAASAKIVNPVNERKWIFKVPQSDNLIAEKMIQYLKKKNARNVAFMSMSTAFGSSGKELFAKVAAANGINIIADEKFGADDKDMTAQLTRIKGLNPDAVIVWAIPPSASTVTKNFHALGMKMPLIHSHGIANKAFIDLAGPDANGVVFPVGKILVAEDLPDTDPQKKPITDYVKDYEGKYGALSRTTFGGHIPDALYLLKQAIEKAGSTEPAKIREAIENTKDFAAVSGYYNFSPEDHNGLTIDALVLVEIADGKWKLLK